MATRKKRDKREILKKKYERAQLLKDRAEKAEEEAAEYEKQLRKDLIQYIGESVLKKFDILDEADFDENYVVTKKIFDTETYTDDPNHFE